MAEQERRETQLSAYVDAALGFRREFGYWPNTREEFEGYAVAGMLGLMRQRWRRSNVIRPGFRS
jgi:hypothetical protein